MPLPGLEPINLVSEEYWYRAITYSAISEYGNDYAVRNIRPSQQSSVGTHLGKLMNVNSHFNFKLSKRICVFG
jgi:hypothetical protein